MSEEKKSKLRPVFENLETAIKTWWKHLLKFVRIYLWGILFTVAPILVFGLILGAGLLGGLEKSVPFIILAGFIGFWAVLFALYFAIRTYLAIYILVKKEYVGKELKIYQESAEYFWSYFSIVILTMVLIFLWLLAFIIPAIIFSVFYCFTIYAFIFEGKRDIDAVKRSQELVKGYWWAIFGRFLLLALLSWLFMMIIAIPLQLAPENSLFASIWAIFIQVINYLVGPIYMLFVYQMYQDLVKIKK